MTQRRADTGLIKPYREKPADFREMYLILGWGSIAEHYRTNWRVIRRWMIEEGRDSLRAERRAVVKAEYLEPGMEAEGINRRKRYVLGRTLSGRSAGAGAGT
jgi:hypothetical protein